MHNIVWVILSKIGLLQTKSTEVPNNTIKQSEIDLISDQELLTLEELKWLLAEEQNENWSYFAPFLCTHIGKSFKYSCCDRPMNIFEAKNSDGSIENTWVVCLLCGTLNNERFVVPEYLPRLRKHHGLKRQFPDKWEEYRRGIEKGCAVDAWILTRPPTFSEYVLGDIGPKLRCSVARLVNDAQKYDKGDQAC